VAALRDRVPGVPLDVFASWEDAASALAEAGVPAPEPAPRPAPPAEAPREDDELDRACRLLRARIRTRPLLSRAQGVLMERYGLPSAEDACELLYEAARAGGVKPHVVASALLAAPRPPTGAGRPWFPDRVREPAPDLPLLLPARLLTRRGAVLRAVLAEALRITGAARGDVQVFDDALGVLVLEKQRGFSRAYTEFFARDPGTGSSAAALRTGRRVVVTDIAHDPLYAGGAGRRLLLETGCRAVQSTPMRNAKGCCVGMISTHSSQTGYQPDRGQGQRLDALAARTAAWLDWHHHGVVLDALEGIHLRAGRRSRTAAHR
jgi:hypothetical protein